MPQPKTRRRKNKKRTTIRKKRGGATQITSIHKNNNADIFLNNTVAVGESDPNDALKSTGFVSNVKSKFKMFPSLEQINNIFKIFSGKKDPDVKTSETRIVVNGEAESQQRKLFEAINLDSLKNDGFYKQIAVLYKIKTGGTLDDLTMFEEYSKTIPKEDSSKPKNNDDAPPPSFMDLLPDIYKNIPDAAVEQIIDSTSFKGVTEIYIKGDPTTYDNVRWAIVLKALSEQPDEKKGMLAIIEK